MKKNFIQRHMIWVSLIVICFMVVPSVQEGYAYKEEPKTIEKTPVKTKEEEKEKKKVVIDPGHGGYDSGSSSDDGKIVEKELTLRIAKRVGELLEQQNIEVVYTRDSDNVSWSSDNVEDLLQRSYIANQSNAACFVSIHLNYSEVYKDEVKGHEIWVDERDKQNVALAKAIHKEMNQIENSTDRGIKDQAISPLSLLVYNEIPSVLIETGFLSNKEDAANINSAQGSEAMAQAIAKGIMTYIS